jgi:hypothetical protein
MRAARALTRVCVVRRCVCVCVCMCWCLRSWNPHDARNAFRHNQSLRLNESGLMQRVASGSRARMLHHIGWHSVLNLALSQHAVALVGSMGSSWSQVTLSMMHRRHRAPVLGCSLRKGWFTDHTYTRLTPAAGADEAAARRVAPSRACLARMRKLCGGARGELLYPGEPGQV